MKPKLYDEHGNSIKNDIPSPYAKFIDKSKLLTSEKRLKIIDLAAKCVDHNTHGALGRSTMCLQSAILVNYMLSKEGIQSTVVGGKAEYGSGARKLKWQHYWVKTDSEEIIDCNIDSVIYLEECPREIEPYNFWGHYSELPNDRVFVDSGNFINIQEIETNDEETVVWKKKIDLEY